MQEYPSLPVWLYILAQGMDYKFRVVETFVVMCEDKKRQLERGWCIATSQKESYFSDPGCLGYEDIKGRIIAGYFRVVCAFFLMLHSF